MRKFLLAIGFLAFLPIFCEAQNVEIEKVEQCAVSQALANTISLYVRQNDFNRIAVSASAKVPETVYISVVVWHTSPGSTNPEDGLDVATMTVTIKKGEREGHSYLDLGGVPGYIVGGVYSASAYSPGSSVSYVVSY